MATLQSQSYPEMLRECIELGWRKIADFIREHNTQSFLTRHVKEEELRQVLASRRLPTVDFHRALLPTFNSKGLARVLNTGVYQLYHNSQKFFDNLMETCESAPEFIMLCRLRMGMNTEEFRRIIDVRDRTLIDKWERGATLPEDSNVIKIVTGANLTTEQEAILTNLLSQHRHNRRLGIASPAPRREIAEFKGSGHVNSHHVFLPTSMEDLKLLLREKHRHRERSASYAAR